MKINITGHETILTPEIKKYTTKKLDKLCRQYKQILSADVVLEQDQGKAKSTAAVAKILLKIKGQDLDARAEAKTVFAAVDETERKLSSQLARDKSKKMNDKNLAKAKNVIRKLFFRNEQ